MHLSPGNSQCGGGYDLVFRDFPSERALRQLRRDNVAYVVVHTAGYDPTQRELVYASLKDFGMADLGEFTDGEGLARLYSRR